MYIPISLRPPPPDSASAAAATRIHGSQVDDAAGVAPLKVLQLAARNATESANTRTGIIIGVVLGVFLLAACAFLYAYRSSVRCSGRRKKRHRRHKSTSSKSSKSSKSSDGGAPPPPPPPPPPPEE